MFIEPSAACTSATAATACNISWVFGYSISVEHKSLVIRSSCRIKARMVP